MLVKTGKRAGFLALTYIGLLVIFGIVFILGRIASAGLSIGKTALNESFGFVGVMAIGTAVFVLLLAVVLWLFEDIITKRFPPHRRKRTATSSSS